MIMNVRPNWRKKTWTGRLNQNLDGRSGVTNYAGHASGHGIGIHVSLESEPDRPVSVLIDHAGVNALRGLIEVYERALIGKPCACGEPKDSPLHVNGYVSGLLKKVPTSPLWVCVDCFLVHCNGECGELPEDAPVPLSKFAKDDQITAGLLLEEHVEDCPNRRAAGSDGIREHECECETQSFSWESCDGCGSPLGGERHAVTAWVYPSESLT